MNNKLFEFADEMGRISDRCDGGRNYSWAEASKDMENILRNIKQYRPRSRGSILIRRLLINEAKYWIKMWDHTESH